MSEMEEKNGKMYALNMKLIEQLEEEIEEYDEKNKKCILRSRSTGQVISLDMKILKNKEAMEKEVKTIAKFLHLPEKDLLIHFPLNMKLLMKRLNEYNKQGENKDTLIEMFDDYGLLVDEKILKNKEATKKDIEKMANCLGIVPESLLKSSHDEVRIYFSQLKEFIQERCNIQNEIDKESLKKGRGNNNSNGAGKLKIYDYLKLHREDVGIGKTRYCEIEKRTSNDIVSITEATYNKLRYKLEKNIDIVTKKRV